VWLPAKPFGEQEPNNDYCRMAASCNSSTRTNRGLEAVSPNFLRE